MATPKRKTNTLETKYKAIMEVEKKKKTKTAIAKEFNIPLNTLSTWLSKADYYKDAYQKQEFGGKVKRLKKGNYEDIENALDQWLRNARSRNYNINGAIIKEKAEELAKEMGYQEFKASTGWLDRMKARKDLKFRVIKGKQKQYPLRLLMLGETPSCPNCYRNFLLRTSTMPMKRACSTS